MTAASVTSSNTNNRPQCTECGRARAITDDGLFDDWEDGDVKNFEPLPLFEGLLRTEIDDVGE